MKNSKFEMFVAVALCVATLALTSYGRSRETTCTGTLNGSLVQLDDSSGETAKAHDVANGVLILSFRGRELRISADARGDYYGTELECGRYRLERALSSRGTELPITEGQHRMFRINSGRHTRFDVMVGPHVSADCKAQPN